MSRHIIVAEYDPNWSSLFEKEAKQIRSILKDNCVEIYHIGSTAVKGLKAKPIIDIMPVVFDLKKVDENASEFEDIGYEYMGEFGLVGRRYLRKGGDERTHHIHIYDVDNEESIGRHIAVREYLRSHKDIADEYGELKTRLALAYPYDSEGYCNGKNDYVKKLEQTAVLWYRSHNLV